MKNPGTPSCLEMRADSLSSNEEVSLLSNEKCYTEARKYTKLSDFIKNSGGAYNASRRNKWLKDFTWLSKKDISQKVVLQFSLDGEFIAKYNGVREACRINGFKTNSVISQCCNGKQNSHQGYIWKYEDNVI